MPLGGVYFICLFAFFHTTDAFLTSLLMHLPETQIFLAYFFSRVRKRKFIFSVKVILVCILLLYFLYYCCEKRHKIGLYYVARQQLLQANMLNDQLNTSTYHL